MDSFSALSGHTSNLMKQLGGERLPPLHTRVILPLMVSSDKDMDLEVCLLASLCTLKMWGKVYNELFRSFI